MAEIKTPIAVMAVRKTSNEFYSWKKWCGWFGNKVPTMREPLKVPRSNKSPIIHMVKLYDEYETNVKPKDLFGVTSITLVNKHHMWSESKIRKMVEINGGFKNGRED